ncbi:MAG: SMP-30/gluconolactonase/LRE family protein [Actinomycetota bacterium]|nr:SMP-30/gluconolactonase/LRE family protein [Actinomycetota bacterium]
MGSSEIFYEGLSFGEGPRWHDGRLWLSDFFSHRVLSFGSSGEAEVEVELDDQPSGLGWLPSGELLVVAMKSRQVRRVDSSGAVHVHADLSAVAGGNCNDMVVDGRGYAYVGNFGFDTEAADRRRRPADLALVRPDATVEVVAEGLEFPNGSVITPDGSTLIVGESTGRRYTAFSIAGDGTLSGRREWADVAGKAPDGCALDAEGAIWMADALGGGCFRVGEGGRILDSVQASQTVFACALGGDDRRTLYMVTAPAYTGGHADGAPTGRVEVSGVEVPGAGWP